MRIVEIFNVLKCRVLKLPSSPVAALLVHLLCWQLPANNGNFHYFPGNNRKYDLAWQVMANNHFDKFTKFLLFDKFGRKYCHGK